MTTPRGRCLVFGKAPACCPSCARSPTTWASTRCLDGRAGHNIPRNARIRDLIRSEMRSRAMLGAMGVTGGHRSNVVSRAMLGEMRSRAVLGAMWSPRGPKWRALSTPSPARGRRQTNWVRPVGASRFYHPAKPCGRREQESKTRRAPSAGTSSTPGSQRSCSGSRCLKYGTNANSNGPSGL